MKRNAVYAVLTRTLLMGGGVLLGFGTNWKVGLGVFFLAFAQAIVTESHP